MPALSTWWRRPGAGWLILVALAAGAPAAFAGTPSDDACFVRRTPGGIDVATRADGETLVTVSGQRQRAEEAQGQKVGGTYLGQLRASALLAAALDFAGMGFPVLPLRERGKPPLTRHGVKDATTDLDQIRSW